MTEQNTTDPRMPATDYASFAQYLQTSRRICALLGAGVSASSGLPTFRGAGGYWRSYDATLIATPGAFRADPGLVWQFYSYRRHMAMNAKPNRAHLALVELARRNPDFITFSQNVDGLSPRAGHPPNQLVLLHGNLFDVKCWDEEGCGYHVENDFTDPIVPALALPRDDQGQATDSQLKASIVARHSGSALLEAAMKKKHALINGVDISDVNVPIPTVKHEDLPQCPSCKKNLLRPGVVWFGENLPETAVDAVDAFFNPEDKVDLMLVIGTSSKVYPAAGYALKARKLGARVAVINMDPADATVLTDKDWFFEGDAAVIVPEILKSVIGEIGEFDETKSASQ